MSRCIYSSILFLSLLPSANSQSPVFNGPVAGFIYRHDSQTVRPLLGIPGATYIAPPVLNGVDSASVAPDGNWAFVTRSGRSVFVQGLTQSAPVEAPADGLIQSVDRVIWNRNGSFALLYSSSGSQLQRVHLAGAGASADPPLDLSPWGQPSALALDPAGRQIAFGVTGLGLFLFKAGQPPVLQSSMAQPAALAFDDTGLRLYAVDLDQQQIVAFDSGSGPLVFASIAQADGSSLKPVGLAVSGGGRYLLLADSTTQAVRVYETASQTLVNTIALDFAPTRFDALSTGPVYLLNGDNSKEWLLVLDARQVPAVYFVPASQQEQL
jgi:DNA-binding beta-propeller fold protein YncE